MTAVEWYTIELKLLITKRENGMNVLDFRNEFDNLSEQANKMFEQQIIEAHGIKENHGWENGRSWWNQKTGEQYYNETFKNKI